MKTIKLEKQYKLKYRYFFFPGMLCGMVSRSTAVLVANIQEILEGEVVNKPAVLEASQVSKNQHDN